MLLILTDLRIFIREKIIKRFFLRFYDFFRTTSDFFKKDYFYLFINIGINLIKILVSGLILFSALLLFGVHSNLILVFSVFNLNRVLALLPVTIAGLGILEGGVSIMLARFGYSYSAVMAAMLFDRVVGTIYTIIALLVVLFSQKKTS